MMHMHKRFLDRVVLITGAARGIGRATAERFAAEGATVAVADLHGAAATAAALGGAAFPLELDVSDRAQVKAAVAALLARCGRLDVLINNAGITRDATLQKTSDEAWDQVIAVNLTGTFNVTREAAPHLVAAGGGAIVNAASIVGLHGNFGQSNYVATKAGVIGLTRVWARELGRTPAGRLGTPGDVAAAYAFLASDDAAFINGQILGVDGGLVLGT